MDILGDGFSNVRYGKYVLVTDNPIAIAGTAAYGEIPITSTFEPPCDGYTFLPGSNMNIALNAYQGVDQALGRPPAVAIEFTPAGRAGPYPLSLWASFPYTGLEENADGMLLATRT